MKKTLIRPLCLVSLPLALAVALLPASAEQPAPGKGVAEVLQPFVDGHSLAGAVTLVADRDKVLAVDMVGFADVAAKTPMRRDSLFWIASQSKPMTAAALMMLVDEGKVKLDDPVEKYLPEFKGQWLVAEQGKDRLVLAKPKHPPTIRHILSHTSGLPFSSALERPTLDRLPLEFAVRSYAMTPLLFEPGSKFLYSNAGINTAGRVIEVASGMPYEEFMQKRPTSSAVEKRPPAGTGCRPRSFSGYLSCVMVVSRRPVRSAFGPYDFASRASCSSLGQKVVSFMSSGPNNRLFRNSS